MIWNEGHLPDDWTIQTLLDKYSSKPFNPDIANALFRSGYIESWGRGISKMTEQSFNFGLPAHLFFFKNSGFWVEFRKDKGKINNSDYQTLHDVSKANATRDLTELVEKFKALDRQN